MNRRIGSVLVLTLLVLGCFDATSPKVSQSATDGKPVLTAEERAPEINAIVDDLNSSYLDIMQSMHKARETGAFVMDNGEITSWVTRHEKKANAVGYTLYWSKEESQYLASPLNSNEK